MSAEIVTLADRRPPHAAASVDRPAVPASVVALPLPASRAIAAPLAMPRGVTAAVAAEALIAACRDLAARFATIEQHTTAIRGRMDALHQPALSVASRGDTIIDALRGVVAVKHDLAKDGSHG